MNKLIPIICLIFIVVSGYSQTNFEKEEVIKKDNAPANAISFVDSLYLPGKIKWFKEMLDNKIFFEAKTKYKGKRLNIKFSEVGAFKNFKVEIATSEIPQVTFNSISGYLRSTHAKYKIDKILMLYSGEPDLVLNFFLTEEVANDLIIKYEVVITTKMEGAFVMFKYFFDKNGAFYRRSRVKSYMTDNLEF